MKLRDWVLRIVCVLSLLGAAPLRAEGVYVFGVLPQRNTLLLAEYWNPILDYVQRKSGIALRFKTTRTSTESDLGIKTGEYDFVYSNHIFQPSLMPVGYQVILRPRVAALKGQLVVLDSSPIRSLADLQNQEVGFPSPSSFAGYALPMDHLIRENVSVSPIFCGNQEGTMGQLKLGKVVAAGVNSEIMASYAARENFRYRVIWQSPPYHDMPIAAHPRVPKAVAKALATTMSGMAEDPEGKVILARSADLIKQPPPLGFQRASQADYQSYVDFFRSTRLKEPE